MKSSTNKVVLQLFDIRGRMISESKYTSNATTFEKELNYRNVAKGLYVLKVENGVHRISKKILIE